jgi:phosphoglycolate phosphatase
MDSSRLSFVFDLDGTLIDSTKDISEAMNSVRAKHGYSEMDLNEYGKLVGLPAISLLEDLMVDVEIKKKLLLEFRFTLREQIIKGVSLFPGVLELIQRLSLSNVEIGIATSKPTDLAIFTISHSNLSDFDLVVQGTDDFEAKPNPEVILRCMERMSGHRFIMVGDRVEDIYAAKSAGIDAIGVAQTTHDQERLKGAGALVTFDSISEMLPKVDLFFTGSFNNF